MGYRAFFSYARADDKAANWLHRQLDGYRTPKALIGQDGALGPVPAKLHPIFRDRTDLDARGHIDQRLQEALEDSECLVVLCTPTSAKSQWVNHECETFLKLGREDRIFPVIGTGEPNSGDPDTECFPPALRGKGLLAADLREIKKPNGQLIGDGRDGGRLKLIAGLLGVPLDQLVQRERRRQRLLISAFGVAALVFAGVSAAAVWQTIAANKSALEAEKARSEAVKNEEEANSQKLKAETAQRLAEENLARLQAEQKKTLKLEGDVLSFTSPGSNRVTFDLAKIQGLWEVSTVYNTGYGHNVSTEYRYICPETAWSTLYKSTAGPASKPGNLVHGSCIRQDGVRLVFKTEEGWAFARYDAKDPNLLVDGEDNHKRMMMWERVNADLPQACRNEHEMPPTMTCDPKRPSKLLVGDLSGDE